MIGRETIMMIQIREFIVQKTDLIDSFFHIANERKLDVKHNGGCWQTAKLLDRMGVTPGISDILISKPNIDYAGMWIEVKAPGKKPSPAQCKFIKNRNKENYYAFWSDDIEYIINKIIKFYDIKIEFPTIQPVP